MILRNQSLRIGLAPLQMVLTEEIEYITVKSGDRRMHAAFILFLLGNFGIVGYILGRGGPVCRQVCPAVVGRRSTGYPEHQDC